MSFSLDSSTIERASGFPQAFKKELVDSSVWNVPTTETLPEWSLASSELNEDFDGDENSDLGDCLLDDLDEELSLLAELSGKLQLHGNELIFRLDADGRVKEWNRQAVETTRFQRDDVVGRDYEDFVRMFIDFDSQHALCDVLQKALVGHETSNFALPFYALDARCIHVLLTTVTRRNALGEILGVFCICKHLTVDNLCPLGNELVFAMDTSGHISEWNSNAVELTGFGKDDVLGRHVDDFVDMFITHDIRSSLQDVLQKTLKGEETTDFAFPLFTLDARFIQVLLSTVSQRNEAGKIVGAICVGRDVTNRKID